MLWRNGDEDVLIDGRNRQKACEMAGIEPLYDRFEGGEDDVRDYIADVNLERRDLKRSQKIMALALLYPKPEGKGGDRTKGSSNPELSQRLGLLAGSLKTGQNRLSQARQILPYEDLKKKVLLLRLLDFLAGRNFAMTQICSWQICRLKRRPAQRSRRQVSSFGARLARPGRGLES
jgi:hypothetical protein